MNRKSIRWIVGGLVVAIPLMWIVDRVAGSTAYRKTDLARAQIRFITEGSLAEYAKVNHRFPLQAEGLDAMVKAELLSPRAIVDPWDHPMLYVCQAPNCSRVLLYSKGPNGIDEGGKGDDIGMVKELSAPKS